MEVNKNGRGFENGKFKDQHGNECSIQKSSSAMEDCIWLGIDNPKLTVFEDDKTGKYIVTDLPKNWMVDSHMHLTREQVRELLPLLCSFVDTGRLIPSPLIIKIMDKITDLHVLEGGELFDVGKVQRLLHSFGELNYRERQVFLDKDSLRIHIKTSPHKGNKKK